MRKFSFLLGVGVGFVLGARAGEERLEQMNRAARAVAGRPAVRRSAAAVQERVNRAGVSAREALGQRAGSASRRVGQSVIGALHTPGADHTQAPHNGHG